MDNETVEELTRKIEGGGEDRAGLLQVRAHLHDMAGDHALAVKDYLAALDLTEDPEAQSYVLAMIAFIHIKLSLFEEAIPFALRSIDAAPSSAEPWHTLAAACAGLGLPRAASRLIEETLRLDPDNEPAVLDRGRFLRSSGDTEASYKLLVDFTSRYPDNPTGFYELGRTLESVEPAGDRVEDAVRSYTRALELDPGEALAHRIQWRLSRLQS